MHGSFIYSALTQVVQKMMFYRSQFISESYPVLVRLEFCPDFFILESAQSPQLRFLIVLDENHE